jgi:hypothetical protein
VEKKRDESPSESSQRADGPGKSNRCCSSAARPRWCVPRAKSRHRASTMTGNNCQVRCQAIWSMEMLFPAAGGKAGRERARFFPVHSARVRHEEEHAVRCRPQLCRCCQQVRSNAARRDRSRGARTQRSLPGTAADAFGEPTGGPRLVHACCAWCTGLASNCRTGAWDEGTQLASYFFVCTC